MFLLHKEFPEMFAAIAYYSKGHYPEANGTNSFDSLKVITQALCGTEAKYLSNADILFNVICVYQEVVIPNNSNALWECVKDGFYQWVFKKDPIRTMTDTLFLDKMIGQIATTMWVHFTNLCPMVRDETLFPIKVEA